MNDSAGEPDAAQGLPDALVETLDGLEPRALRAVADYVEDRLANAQVPIADLIDAEGRRDVLDVDDRGPYTLVRTKTRGAMGADEDPRGVSLYHVSREQRLDGEETLHWSFLGDLYRSTMEASETCGAPADAETCPHGSEDAQRNADTLRDTDTRTDDADVRHDED